jgi:hypothetical protein
MQNIYRGGIIYFQSKLDITLNKEVPSFYDHYMLLKKQTLEVCKPGALYIPKLMVFTIFG